MVAIKLKSKWGINSPFTLLFLTILISACAKVSNNQANSDIIATVYNENMYSNELDSVLNFSYYNLQKSSLNLWLNNKVFEYESLKLNIHPDSLSSIITNDVTVTLVDFSDFQKQNPYYPVKSEFEIKKVKETILSIKRQEKIIQFIDSCKLNNNQIAINLECPYPYYENIKKLSGKIIGNLESNTQLYFISDYDCPECREKYKIIRRLFNQYGKKVNFELIYYSDAIDSLALVSGLFKTDLQVLEFYDELYTNESYLNNNFKRQYLNLANKKFLETAIHKYQKNFDVLKENDIYSVPQIIINGYLLPNQLTAQQIEEELIFQILKGREK